MLKLGNKNISKLYYGDKAISKAYLGDKLVFQAGKPMFLECIKFNGTQYINTGIDREKGKYGKWVVTAKSTDTTHLKMLLGNGGTGIHFFGCNAIGKWGFGANIYFDINADTKITADIVFEDTQVTAVIDDKSLVRTGTISSFDVFTLGNFGLVENQYNFNGYVYGCSYTDVDGNLALDLRPCIDTKGVVCMYDTVSHKYFYNEGTGEFIAGGRFVESIVFDGNSYINTGIQFQNCNVETLMQFENSGTRQLMGFSSTSGYWWGAETSGGINSIPNTNAFEKNKINIEWVINEASSTFKRTITINDTITNIFDKYVLQQTTLSYIIGSLASNTVRYPLYGTVYYNKIYNADGVLIQDLRPYVDGNNVACFKDVITGELFYNQGTGKLGYSE